MSAQASPQANKTTFHLQIFGCDEPAWALTPSYNKGKLGSFLFMIIPVLQRLGYALPITSTIASSRKQQPGWFVLKPSLFVTIM